MLVSIALVPPAEPAAGAEHGIARFPGPGYSVDQVAGIAVAPDGSPPYEPRPETRRLLVACATTLALLALGAPAASARPFRQDTTKCRQGVAQERIRADGYGKVAEPLLTIRVPLPKRPRRDRGWSRSRELAQGSDLPSNPQDVPQLS